METKIFHLFYWQKILIIISDIARHCKSIKNAEKNIKLTFQKRTLNEEAQQKRVETYKNSDSNTRKPQKMFKMPLFLRLAQSVAHTPAMIIILLPSYIIFKSHAANISFKPPCV